MALQRISIFPLDGALLFPRMHLPLHIFEPRYRAMVTEAMARGQRFGMIQPSGPGEPPPLITEDCGGSIAEIEALEDGRFNIILAGEARFRVQRELDVPTAFRQVEAELFTTDDGEADVLAPSERAALEDEARAFADSLGYVIEWDAVETLDD